MEVSMSNISQLDSLTIYDSVKDVLDTFFKNYNNISIGKEKFKKIALEEIESIKYSEESFTSFQNILLKKIEKRLKIEQDINLDSNYYNLLSDIKKYRVLTNDEINELIPRAQNGDEEAKEIIVNHNLKLVLSVSKSFLGYGIEFDDLAQEGIVGLLIAINRYDVSKGIKFSTYATYWIKCMLFNTLYNNSRIIKISVYQQKMIVKYKKAYTELFEELEREPSIEEIANKLNISYEKCLKIYNFQQAPVHLNKKITSEEGDNCELGDFIESDEIVEDKAMGIFLKSDVRKALYNSKLTNREIYVIINRFGFYGNEEKTLNEIGKELNITREGVRRLEKSALNKLFKSKLIYYNNNSVDQKRETTGYETIKKSLTIPVYNYLYACKLSPLEMLVISHSLGLIDNVEKNQNQISKIVNKSRSSVSFILKKAYEKLKNIPGQNEFIKAIYNKDKNNSENNQITRDYNIDNSIRELNEKKDIKLEIEEVKNINTVIHDLIEKMYDTVVFKELIKYFSIKEVVIILLLNGYDDSYYSGDVVAKMLNVSLEKVTKVFRKSNMLYKQNKELEKDRQKRMIR